MHNYYRITKKIQLLTDISLLKITQRKKSITKENSKVINEHFYSFNNILYCEPSYLKTLVLIKFLNSLSYGEIIILLPDYQFNLC